MEGRPPHPSRPPPTASSTGEHCSLLVINDFNSNIKFDIAVEVINDFNSNIKFPLGYILYMQFKFQPNQFKFQSNRFQQNQNKNG